MNKRFADETELTLPFFSSPHGLSVAADGAERTHFALSPPRTAVPPKCRLAENSQGFPWIQDPVERQDRQWSRVGIKGEKERGTSCKRKVWWHAMIGPSQSQSISPDARRDWTGLTQWVNKMCGFSRPRMWEGGLGSKFTGDTCAHASSRKFCWQACFSSCHLPENCHHFS